MANNIRFDKTALDRELSNFSTTFNNLENKIKEVDSITNSQKDNWKCVEAERLIKKYDSMREYYSKMKNVYEIYYSYLNNAVSTTYVNLENEISTAITNALKGSDN